MSYYLHALPGRLRIKIPSLRRNLHQAQELVRLLNGLSGVESAAANTVTGSITVRYDPTIIGSSSILTFLAKENHIDLEKAVSTEKHVDTAVANVGRAVSKAVLGFALDRALQGSPLAILTALI